MKYSKQSGFSLVELMIGALIGLITMVVIGQVFTSSVSENKSSISGGDAVQSGALAIYLLDKDIQQAGHGFNNSVYMGCTVRSHNEASNADYSYTFAPVIIQQGANAPDSLTILYSTSTRVSYMSTLKENVTDSGQRTYKVSSNYGFNPGDRVVIAEAASKGKTCTQLQITSTQTLTPASSEPEYKLTFQPGATYTDIFGQQQTSKYNWPSAVNLPTGSNPGFSSGAAKLFNLSNNTVSMTFSVSSNNLLATAAGGGDQAVVASDVVDLQAQYGVDTNNDLSVDVYQDTTPANFSQVVAIRYAILARVSKRENDCTLTPSAPSWRGGSFNAVTSLPDWQCYRYRVYQGTSSLRNLLWKVDTTS